MRRRNAVHGGDERFVISQERELPAFKKETEVPDGEECSGELPVERGVLDLS
jgi:hypothetical protein